MTVPFDPAVFDHFRVSSATSPSAVAESMRVRFEVYCHELGYEQAKAFPDCAEFDRFDAHAWHSLVWHSASGLVAGSVRFIMPCSGTSETLPIFEHISPADCGRFCADHAQIGEVSRLAVRPRFRRHGQPPPEVMACADQGLIAQWQEDRLWFGQIGGLLAYAAVAMFEHSDCDAFVILSRSALVKRLHQLGIALRPLGPEIDHRGRRGIYAFDRHDLNAMPTQTRLLLDRISLGLDHAVATPVA